MPVPFDYSMHNYLLRYYLAEHGLDPDTDVQIRSVPPPEMVANLRADNIDGLLAPDPVNQRAVYDGVGPSVFKEVTKLSRLSPGGLTPIPLFPPNLTNHQVLVATLSVPTPGPITMPTPGYIQMNGSLAEDRLFFASEPVSRPRPVFSS